MDLWTTEDFLDAVITALDGTHSDTLDAAITVEQSRMGQVDIVLTRGKVSERRRLTFITAYAGPVVSVHPQGRSI